MPKYRIMIKDSLYTSINNLLIDYDSICVYDIVGYIEYVCSMIKALARLYDQESITVLVNRYTNISIDAYDKIVELRNNLLHGNLVEFRVSRNGEVMDYCDYNKVKESLLLILELLK